MKTSENGRSWSRKSGVGAICRLTCKKNAPEFNFLNYCSGENVVPIATKFNANLWMSLIYSNKCLKNNKLPYNFRLFLMVTVFLLMELPQGIIAILNGKSRKKSFRKTTYFSPIHLPIPLIGLSESGRYLGFILVDQLLCRLPGLCIDVLFVSRDAVVVVSKF